jgi:hypothetical protein
LTDLSHSDVLVRGLLAVNTISDEEDAERASSECRMRSVSQSGGGYGLGNGEYSEHTHSASASGAGAAPRGGNSYGSAIVSFACSRLALALECGLTVQEVSNGLYSLQCRGLLEYALDDSCVYLEVLQEEEKEEGKDDRQNETDSGGNCEKHLIMSLRGYLTAIGAKKGGPPLSSSQHHSYVWYAARHVHSLLRSINRLASERIVDMWRIGGTICRYSAIPSDDDSSRRDRAGQAGRAVVTTSEEAVFTAAHSPEEIQTALQQFVCRAMEQIREGDVPTERFEVF